MLLLKDTTLTVWVKQGFSQPPNEQLLPLKKMRQAVIYERQNGNPENHNV